MKTLSTILTLALLLYVSCARAEDPTSAERAAALAFVKALFVDHDPAAALPFIATDAARKAKEPGSFHQQIQQTPPKTIASLVLREVIFFEPFEVEALQKRFPSDKGALARTRDRIEGGLGVLIVFAPVLTPHQKAAPPPANPRVGLMTLVLKSIDGKPQIVYSDDN